MIRHPGRDAWARAYRAVSGPFRRLLAQLRGGAFDRTRRTTAQLDRTLQEKDAEIARLRSIVARLETQFAAARTRDLHTDLPNRTSFIEQVQHRLKQADAWDPFLVVAARFWQLGHVSHSLGAAAASELMREAAARLRSLVGDGASIARIGDNELGLLLPASEALTPPEIARRLLGVIEDRFQVGDQGVYVRAVLGVARSTDVREGGSDLLDKASLAADEAFAKDEKCIAFRTETQEEVTSLLQLEADLQGALESRQLALHYQPIVSVAEGRTVGFEALLRWLHPSGSTILPERFIPVAESLGHMSAISDWAFTSGVQQSKRWRSLLETPVYLSMNLRPRDLNPEFCGAILDMIDNAGLAPESIGVELTETAVVRDFRLAAQLIERLRERGVLVLLDDFGTGYSSLSYLRELPFHCVKIDKSFVHRMTSDARDFGLVRSIVSLVHYLGMECVAEGIETQEQLELITMIDCDYWQGDLFSEPGPANEAEALAGRRAPLVSASPEIPGGR